MLCRVSGRLVLVCCVVLPCSGLRCCVLHRAVSLGAVLCRVAARRSVWHCPVLCRVVLCDSFVAVACCVVPSGAVRCLVVLCFLAQCFVLFPRPVRSVLHLSCRGVLVCAVVCRCALCCVCVLCVSWGVVLRVACPLRSVRCCGAWCLVLGVLLCVVPCPVVFCDVVLGLVARGCTPVACFGIGVPVWLRGLLPCGRYGLRWCPAPLCCVLWCSAVVWCCAVVLCCLLAVLFVFALSFAVSRAAVLPCGALLLGCVFCCPLLRVSLLFSETPAKNKTQQNVHFWKRKLYTTQHRHAGVLCAVLSAVPFPFGVVWCVCALRCLACCVALPCCGLSCGAMLSCLVLLAVSAVFCLVVASVCCGAPFLPAGMH